MAEYAVSAVVFPEGVRTCMKSHSYFYCTVHSVNIDGQITLYQGEFAGCNTFMTHTGVAILPTGLTINSLKFQVIFNGPNQSRLNRLH